MSIQALPETREICPNCGSRQVLNIEIEKLADSDCPLSVCADCRKMWETPPEMWRGTKPVECGPCDNCAFRLGSEESQDPEVWSAHLRSVINRSPFYCHKGVPRELVSGDAEFEFKMDRLTEYRVCGGWAQAVREFHRCR